MRAHIGHSECWLLASALFLAALMLFAGPAPRVADATEPDVPPAVAALLPANSTLVSAYRADLTGDGVDEWALLYTVPQNSPWADAHVSVAVPGSSAWYLANTVTVEYAMVPSIQLVDVAGTTSIALSAGVGAHGSILLIVRWDGSNFATVFDGGSNSPGLDLADVDGDGIPEVVDAWSPYCEAYAVSPKLVSVYRWDGAAFVEATGRYPRLVAAVAADIRAALANEGIRPDTTWTNSGRACLHLALGYLANAVGDLEAVRDACRRARDIDPDEYQLLGFTFCD